MARETSELVLELSPGPDADSSEVFALTAKLRRELLDLDVQRVDRPSEGKAPEGARGLDVAAAGTLIVQTLGSLRTLRAIIAKINEFLSRDKERSATITIGGDTLQMSGLTSEDQERLIRDWVERHADRDERVER